MSLHDQIMAKTESEKDAEAIGCLSQALAYNTAIRHCAKIAKEADELMGEMAEVLDCCGMGMVCHNRARAMVKKYEAWKENKK